MTGRRWWDVLVPVVSAGTIVFMVLSIPEPGIVGPLAVLLFAGAYFLVQRPAAPEPSRRRFAVFVAVMAAAIALGVADSPFVAMLQVLAYPLVWISGRTRTDGVIGSLAIGLAVFAGSVARDGLTVDAFLEGALSAGLAVVFAIAMGLWISSIAEYGEERARLVTELTAAQSQVEALSHEQGVAHERERVARDIHDTLAQTLAGLVLLSERAGRQARDERWEAAIETIGTVEQAAREALAESRALITRMAAVPADDALTAAIDRLAERFRTEAGLAIDVDVAPGAVLDRETQVVLLRCLQEALANVRKHARATLVSVSIGREPGTVRMDVADDGVGFDVGASSTGFGLDGLRDRASLAGGSLKVVSTSGEGSTLTIRLPAAEVAA